MRRTQKIAIIVIVFILLASAAVSAIQLPGIDLSGGLIWIGNAEEEGGPSPLLGIWGVGLPLQFSPLFSIEPELSMFGTQYQLMSDGIKAVPTEIEYADSLWTLILSLDVPFRFTFYLNEALSLGPAAHAVFVFRIPMKGWGEASAQTGDPEHRKAISTYFYSNASFLYPGVGFFFNWKIFESLGFHFRLLSLFPLFHLWDGENAPFWDQMGISARVGVRFYF